jgi:hypothetical protein
MEYLGNRAGEQMDIKFEDRGADGEGAAKGRRGGDFNKCVVLNLTGGGSSKKGRESEPGGEAEL